MDPETIERIVILVLAGLVVMMGLWYLAVRLNQPRIKMFALMFGGFPLLAAGVTLSDYFFDWSNTAHTFTTYTPGPAAHEASVTRDFPFPVTDPNYQHEVMLIPSASEGEAPTQPIKLVVAVRSPAGMPLLDKTESLEPMSAQYWATMRARFQPVEQGDHMLHLEIPAGVHEVQVEVREVRKK